MSTEHRTSASDIRPVVSVHPVFRPGAGTAIFWVVTGLIAWVVSFLLYLEYIGQLTDAPPLVSCDINPIVTCGPNLLSPAGNLLGFTNAIIGMVAFVGPILAGVGALAAPGGMRAWYWRIFSLCVLGGFALVHFFAYRSVFEFGSLCPWCMVIWLMTIPLFWSTAVESARRRLGRGPARRGGCHRAMDGADRRARLRGHRRRRTAAARPARRLLLITDATRRASAMRTPVLVADSVRVQPRARACRE